MFPLMISTSSSEHLSLTICRILIANSPRNRRFLLDPNQTIFDIKTGKSFPPLMLHAPFLPKLSPEGEVGLMNTVRFRKSTDNNRLLPGNENRWFSCTCPARPYRDSWSCPEVSNQTDFPLNTKETMKSLSKITAVHGNRVRNQWVKSQLLSRYEAQAIGTTSRASRL